MLTFLKWAWSGAMLFMFFWITAYSYNFYNGKHLKPYHGITVQNMDPTVTLTLENVDNAALERKFENGFMPDIFGGNYGRL